jgi:hypothetical protein
MADDKSDDKAIIKIPESAGEAVGKAVDHTAAGLGTMLGPWHAKRWAKARLKVAKLDKEASQLERENALYRAETEIQLADLHRRTAYRVAAEDLWHQQNMEQIQGQAQLLLPTGADPDAVDDDWIANFCDKSRNVSNEQMQTLWARLLAGEITKPGSFSRRTVNLLDDLDREDCDAFALLCNYVWQVDTDRMPLVLDPGHEIYVGNGLSWSLLTHLDSIGLVSFDNDGNVQLEDLPDPFVVTYQQTTLSMSLEPRFGKRLPVGTVVFTSVGEQLARLCNVVPVPGLVEHVLKAWEPFVRKPDAPTS